MKAVSRALDRSVRSLHADRKLAASEVLLRPVGRPAHSSEARWKATVRVREELEVQGFTAGWRPVAKALPEVPKRLVQEECARWKARHRVRCARGLASRRESVQVHARDAVWSIDATHLGRDGGEAQQAEVVKDLGTTKLVGVSLGTVATGAEIVGILERARAERGAAPFVLSHDNGRAYCSGEVARWCAKHGVVELVNEPRTPQHNAACERGIGELKAECGLGSGCELAGLAERVWIGDVDEVHSPSWCVDVRRAAERLDRGRLRGRRGYKTAEQLDREMRPSESWACRESFHQAACCAIENAVRDAQGARARRRATRQAIYGTLERFGMVTRTRGGVPFSSSAGAGVS